MHDERTFLVWCSETAVAYEELAARNEDRAKIAKNREDYRRRAQMLRMFARMLRQQEE
jgi:hypothetical protein